MLKNCKTIKSKSLEQIKSFMQTDDDRLFDFFKILFITCANAVRFVSRVKILPVYFSLKLFYLTNNVCVINVQ